MTNDLKDINKARQRGMAAIVAHEDHEDYLMVRDEVGSKVEWILDSGNTHHICAYKEWFSSFEECDEKFVTLPNGKEVKVEGIGVVELQLHICQVWKLVEVRYIPRLERNLIYLGRLGGLTYNIRVKNGRMWVTKGEWWCCNDWKTKGACSCLGSKKKRFGIVWRRNL